MSKKAILTTFIMAIVLVALVGALSFLMAKNRPSADVATPPVPPVPSSAPADYPPVPPSMRLKGDANNDGIVNVLDLGVIISNWQQTDMVHNLVDDINGKANFINVLDLSQVITYWGCTEQKSGCGYYGSGGATPTPTPTPTGTAIVPPPVPTLPPVSSSTATAATSPNPTATSSPTQDYIIKSGETKAIDGYPFSIMYYSGGVSGYYYTYFVARNIAGSEKCVSKFQTFFAQNYAIKYSCGSSQYAITLDPNKSSASQITVAVVKKTVTATTTTTVKPTVTPTALPACRWYNRWLGHCI